jgi:hypothetical protein
VSSHSDGEGVVADLVLRLDQPLRRERRLRHGREELAVDQEADLGDPDVVGALDAQVDEAGGEHRASA